MQDILQALETIDRTIADHLAKAATLKRAANMMAAGAGLAQPYSDADMEVHAGGSLRIRSDQFVVEKAPASAARAYLALRGKDRGATTADDIYEALVRGGYDFGSLKEPDAKSGLKIALAKDGKVHRLKNGHFGLREWYGIADEEKVERTKAKSEKAEEKPSVDDGDAAPPVMEASTVPPDATETGDTQTQARKKAPKSKAKAEETDT